MAVLSNMNEARAYVRIVQCKNTACAAEHVRRLLHYLLADSGWTRRLAINQ